MSNAGLDSLNIFGAKIQHLMESVNSLQRDLQQLRSTVGAAFEILWARTHKNEDHCIRRFRACKQRLRTAREKHRLVREQLHALVSDGGGGSRRLFNHLHGHDHSDGMLSPVSLASANSPASAHDARRMKELFGLQTNKKSDDDGDDDDGDKPSATVRRRRLAAAQRRKSLCQPPAEQQPRVAPVEGKEAVRLSAAQSSVTPIAPAAQQEPHVALSPPVFVPLVGADLSYVRTGGAVCVRIPAASALDLSGVRVGDKIWKVDGRRMVHREDFEWLLKRRAGDPVHPDVNDDFDDDSDIFGPSLHDARAAAASAAAASDGNVLISVIPAAKARKHLTFQEMNDSAVPLSVPASSPVVKKQERPSSLSPRGSTSRR